MIQLQQKTHRVSHKCEGQAKDNDLERSPEIKHKSRSLRIQEKSMSYPPVNFELNRNLEMEMPISA